MPQFIKSHSNYVLKKKHQEVNNGDIFERDITTINGLNQFAKGQIPIYKSGNFIITTGRDNNVTRSVISEKWEENANGEIWTMNTIDTETASNDVENDVEIVLKQDYYDLSDFAYFGSCSELVRASITDILRRFPGEITPAIISDDPLTAAKGMYTDSITGVGDRATTLHFGEYVVRDKNGKPQFEKDEKTGESNGYYEINKVKDYYIIDNPFGINVYNTNLSIERTSQEPLKYFCNEGYKLYSIYTDDKDCPETGYTINSWVSHPVVEGYPYNNYNLGWVQTEIEYDDCPQVTFDTVDERDSLEKFVNDSRIKPYIPSYKKIDSLNASLPFGMPDKEVEGYFNDIVSSIKDKYEEYVKSGDTKSDAQEKVKEYVENEIKKKVQVKLDSMLGLFDSIINNDQTFEFIPSSLFGNSDITYTWGDKPSGKFNGQNYGASSKARVRTVVWCPGNRVAQVTFNISNGKSLTLDVFCGNNKEPIYMVDENGIQQWKKVHIRPNAKQFFRFWDSLDNFQKILLNYKTDPLYTAQFQIVKENDFGYYREVEFFEFPKTYGGYNISTSASEFGSYIQRLSDIAAFYDERFCDNLYRSMTHESIKNFDWTYTREYIEGDEKPYVEGGNKTQKAIRLFGREFDEIKSYIDNINNTNTITYDEIGNLPDYFLTDVLELDGWDLRVVTPLKLVQYTKNGNSNNILTPEEENSLKTDSIINNKYGDKHLHRSFSQDTLRMVSPYSKEKDCYGDGYFVTCDDNSEHCKNSKLVHKAAKGATLYDNCAGVLRHRIRNYSSEEEYTMYDVNNEFMKRLKLNSRHILRHKGTIEGIEMIMAMFGMRSKRWYDSLSVEEKKKYKSGFDELKSNCKSLIEAGYSPYDYEIKEYTSFTKRINDTWDQVNDMYHIDWINSTKLITYEYSTNEGNVTYLPYQGIPVAYRDDDYYMWKKCKGKTKNLSESFINGNGDYVPARYLYPKFNYDEQYDGNPYFQMDGGWISKHIVSGKDRLNATFDKDDNFIFTHDDNNKIFTETIRNIRSVQNLKDLLDISMLDLNDSDIYYVNDISVSYAVIDGSIYPIKYDENGQMYINIVIFNGTATIGNAFFENSDAITVYNENGEENSYSLTDKMDGYEIRAYIFKDKIKKFIAIGRSGQEITSFALFENGRIINNQNDKPSDLYTHYFILKDINGSGHLYTEETLLGWKQLISTDSDYYKVNSIVNYYKGNNPHSGNNAYDNGHKYYLYLKELFKYAYEEDMFDARCYGGYVPYQEILQIGFSGLVNSNVEEINYDKHLIEDKKVHYFGNYKIPDETRYIYSYHMEDDNNNPIQGKFDEDLINAYKKRYKNNTIKGYNLSTKDMIDKFTGYTEDSVKNIPFIDKDTLVDASTNQIVNNKRLKMIIYMRNNSWGSNNGLCELKYLQSVILEYVSQLIPSSTIFEIEFVENGKGTGLPLKPENKTYSIAAEFKPASACDTKPKLLSATGYTYDNGKLVESNTNIKQSDLNVKEISINTSSSTRIVDIVYNWKEHPDARVQPTYIEQSGQDVQIDKSYEITGIHDSNEITPCGENPDVKVTIIETKTIKPQCGETTKETNVIANNNEVVVEFFKNSRRTGEPFTTIPANKGTSIQKWYGKVTYKNVNAPITSKDGTKEFTQGVCSSEIVYEMRANLNNAKLDACGDNLVGATVQKRTGKRYLNTSEIEYRTWSNAILGTDYIITNTEPNNGSSRHTQITIKGIGLYSSFAKTETVTQNTISKSKILSENIREDKPYMYMGPLEIRGNRKANSCDSGTEQFTAWAIPIYKTKVNKYFMCGNKKVMISEGENGPDDYSMPQEDITTLCDWNVEDVTPIQPEPTSKFLWATNNGTQLTYAIKEQDRPDTLYFDVISEFNKDLETPYTVEMTNSTYKECVSTFRNENSPHSLSVKFDWNKIEDELNKEELLNKGKTIDVKLTQHNSGKHIFLHIVIEARKEHNYVFSASTTDVGIENLRGSKEQVRIISTMDGKEIPWTVSKNAITNGVLTQISGNVITFTNDTSPGGDSGYIVLRQERKNQSYEEIIINVEVFSQCVHLTVRMGSGASVIITADSPLTCNIQGEGSVEGRITEGGIYEPCDASFQFQMGIGDVTRTFPILHNCGPNAYFDYPVIDNYDTDCDCIS